MELGGGVPILNCLLQCTLRSLCCSTSSSSSSSTSSSKWVYAVFWKILPRNYPPPKWDCGGGALDRARGNKRNWILVWEDGFCDFYECNRAGGSRGIKGRFGADVFFKMSHEVYSYGEGLVGKVAADNSHKWVFRDSPTENDPNSISSWNVLIDPQPRAWQFQFHSGIQTIAIISVREGLIQLGSFHKVVEDLNLVISIQRKFSYLSSLAALYAVQRPYTQLQPSIQNPHNYKSSYNNYLPENNEPNLVFDEKPHLKRINDERTEEFPLKSPNLCQNSSQNVSPTIWPIPPLFSSMPCSFGALLSRSRFQEGINDGEKRIKLDFDIKREPFCLSEEDKKEDNKPMSLNPHLGLGTVELDYGP